MQHEPTPYYIISYPLPSSKRGIMGDYEKQITHAYNTAHYAQEHNVLLNPMTLSIFYGFVKGTLGKELTPEITEKKKALVAILDNHAQEYKGAVQTMSAHIPMRRAR
jgi:hypothetical protein